MVGLVHLGVDERLAPLAAAALALPVSFLAARFVITKAVLEPRPFAAARAVTPRSAPSVGEAVTRPIPLVDRR